MAGFYYEWNQFLHKKITTRGSVYAYYNTYPLHGQFSKRREGDTLMCSFFKEPTRFCLLPSHAITIELCLPGIATISATLWHRFVSVFLTR